MAGREKVDEVLFVGPGQVAREGGTTNLFVRRSNVLETHPSDGSILEGVTRGTLLALAKQEGIPVIQQGPPLDKIESWQEAFLCGTTTGVQPLVEIDGRPINDGSPGDWTRRLAGALDALERGLISAAAAR